MEKLDPNKLERHWIEQSTFMDAACHAYAAAKNEHDALAINLKVWEAETSVEIRNNPNRYGLDKLTEAAVKEALRTHPDYLLHHNDLIDAQKSMDFHEAEIKSLVDRKAAISGLVKLHELNYFSIPYIDPNTKSTATKGGKKATKKRRT